MKPDSCKFCGADCSDCFGDGTKQSTDPDVKYWVYCWKCGATGPDKHTIEEAIAAWNKRGWISVEDRLPEYDTFVLVHWSDGNQSVFHFWAIKWEDISRYGGADITHWMPLPDPPEDNPIKRAEEDLLREAEKPQMNGGIYFDGYLPDPPEES